MKHKLIILAFIIIATSCEKADPPDLLSLNIQKPSEITETSFQLNWNTNNQDFQSIIIDLSLDRDLEVIEEHVNLSDATLENYLFTLKKGATKYYYTISLIREDETVVVSDIQSVETSYSMQGITIVTSDGLNLKGSIAYLESETEARGGIIMMHELGVWVNPWIGSDLLKLLVSEGYVCMSFFFRGHGTSSPIEGDLTTLVEDKSLIAKDLHAAISFMNDQDMVNQGSLGLVGASLGGIMALAGNGYKEVLTSVSLSAPANGVYEIFPNMTLSSVYYLVGDRDIRPEINADFPRDAQALYNSTQDPKKLTVVEGTSDHGTALLSREELNVSIKKWIIKTLPVK